MKEDSSNNGKITLFTQDVHNCYIEKFVGETLNCAVLYTGGRMVKIFVDNHGWLVTWIHLNQKIY